MIVSASMPFSLASASIVCISGFCMFFLKLHLEPAARDEAQREPVNPFVRRLEQHGVALRAAAVDAAQAPVERFLIVDRLPDDNLRAPSAEARVIVGVA